MERAFYASDPAWDGRFVAAVRTTGIFCRPSCRVRKPLPKNVEYLADAAAARAAGYRACLRCQPENGTAVTLRAIPTRRSDRCWPAPPPTRSCCATSPIGAMIDAQLASVRRRIGPTREGNAPLLDRLESQLAGVLRGHAPRLRPADRHARQRLPGARLGRAAAHPVRRDDQLPRAGRARRRRRGLPRRRSRQRLEPRGGRGPLPPRHRDRRRAGRLRRRAAGQAHAPRPRTAGRYRG